MYASNLWELFGCIWKISVSWIERLLTGVIRENREVYQNWELKKKKVPPLLMSRN